MKTKLNFFEKFIYALNLIFVVCLIIAYLLPFVPPKFSAFLSILNLGLPFFLFVNFLFFFYWLVKLKRQMLLSLFAILVGFGYFNKIYVFSDSVKYQSPNVLKVMSYNVRLFNHYKWIEQNNITNKISDFIRNESPDVVAFQDYYKDPDLKLTDFKYKFEKFKHEGSRIGMAIFSKYKIVNTGTIDFPKTQNNAIFADIIKNRDTLRVYAVHLESLKILPDVEELQKEDQQKLISRVGKSFVKQEEQVEMLKQSFESTDLPKIICMDMNNAPFSYVSNQILKHNLRDAFTVAGNGFGKTFDFDFLPIRIDVIFSEKSIKVLDFKNYEVQLSDHYPIMASFAF
ncbi:endonuclease/exonuclease/phosphatase family protein [Psychroflexus aestuariivivens]|uniref:endonuclease/exonuclease/phosphatase family protein n=1 Tax=Psychroflexus aestuariivivens TaxID=1795040 RepID=UPI000FD9D3F0|nr:endonuclease/exonuclease/phosphatase family protein [Psychroflexus aestuariivivens]